VIYEKIAENSRKRFEVDRWGAQFCNSGHARWIVSRTLKSCLPKFGWNERENAAISIETLQAKKLQRLPHAPPRSKVNMPLDQTKMECCSAHWPRQIAR